MSEMALAWSFGRLVIGMRCGGTSELLADSRIDERVRYPALPNDRVFGATTAEEALALLQLWLPHYVKVHPGIQPAR